MNRPLYLTGAIAGVVLTLGTLFYVVFGMMRAFATLSGSGISDPQGLSRAIDKVLVGSASIFVAMPLGGILAVYCIVKLINARKAPPSLPRR